ncbi:MAG: DUF924 domain-containing protein [Alphaproteobacteria bacterium]|nr:DUF924 domain-containing protein [Alphaproteobacteria bacterium]
MSTETISEINAFWLGSSLDNAEAASDRRDWWYRGGVAVDDDIRARFGGLVQQACARDLMAWQATPDGALALILLLDQFTRNLYRNTPQAYMGDECAFEIVRRAIEQKFDKALPPVSRIWLYHPFHHAEEVEDQDRGIALLNELRQEAAVEWRPYVERSIEGWTRHRDIVAQFGRFPHRNAVLGRGTTDDEAEFLNANSEAFGQGPKPAAA